jgi:hypothetical protein
MPGRLKISSQARAAVLAAGVIAAASPVTAQQWVKTGTLSCDVSGGLGMIIMQKQEMTCTFTPDGGGKISRYTGKIEEFGLALGGVQEGHLIWGVASSTNGVAPGALAGTYEGLGAEATAGVGLGANVLLGGSNRAFALQPVSVEGQVGLNIAAGVTKVTLRSAP